MKRLRFSPTVGLMLAWLVTGLAAIGIVAALGAGARRVVAAVIAIAVVGIVVFLHRAGRHARRCCGFCGYDRHRLGRTQPCPECGVPGDRPGGPLHRAVGHRALPVWLWVPALLAVPAIIVAGGLSGRPEIAQAGVVGFGALLIAAGWWAWSRGK